MAAGSDNEGSCLSKGSSAPDLGTIKDFIQFCINISKGQFSLRPIWSAEINKKDRSDVFKISGLSQKYQDIILLICLTSGFARL
jgi:hypothetical protein